MPPSKIDAIITAIFFISTNLCREIDSDAYNIISFSLDQIYGFIFTCKNRYTVKHMISSNIKVSFPLFFMIFILPFPLIYCYSVLLVKVKTSLFYIK